MPSRAEARAIADPFLDALDFPDMGLLSPVRGFSASALQSLALFNNEYLLKYCENFAARLDQQAKTPEAKIQTAFQLTYQRPASAEEVADFTTLAAQQGMPSVCRVLFNSNEFLFLD